MTNKQKNQPSMKLYAIGFAIGIVLAIGLFLIFGGNNSSQTTGDNSDKPPALPFDDNSNNIINDGNSNNNANLPAIPDDNPVLNSNQELVSSWRVYSSRLFYNEGGGGSVQDSSTASTTKLEIRSGGRWIFGSSSGTWEVSKITNSDWTSWGVNSYGPTRKITLNGWKSNDNYASGPIEETDTEANFLWVIYKTGPPTVSKAGQVQTKFGH